MRQAKHRFFLISWILISSLTLSPLLAQDRSPHPLNIERARQRLMKEPIPPTEAGTTALPLVPPKAELDVLPDRTDGTTAGATQTSSPGKASAAIIGVLIAGGAALATLLYFAFRSHKTVLEAGAPRVIAP